MDGILARQLLVAGRIDDRRREADEVRLARLGRLARPSVRHDGSVTLVAKAVCRAAATLAGRGVAAVAASRYFRWRPAGRSAGSRLTAA